jgi:MinD-like ATPase involved in chromosome partitioning or flagellar assembly
MSPYVPDQMAGKLFLIPASADPRDASRVLHEKYHIKLLTDRLRDFSEQMGLDVLLIDTRSGISDKTLLTMLSIGVCDTMLVVMRLDQREYQGTGVAIDVAQMLEIPRIMLTINQMPAVYDPADVQREVEHAYNRDVAALIPYADEIVSMEMANIFVTHFPNHRAIPAFAQLADMLLRPLELE